MRLNCFSCDGARRATSHWNQFGPITDDRNGAISIWLFRREGRSRRSRDRTDDGQLTAAEMWHSLCRRSPPSRLCSAARPSSSTSSTSWNEINFCFALDNDDDDSERECEENWFDTRERGRERTAADPTGIGCSCRGVTHNGPVMSQLPHATATRNYYLVPILSNIRNGVSERARPAQRPTSRRRRSDIGASA